MEPSNKNKLKLIGGILITFLAAVIGLMTLGTYLAPYLLPALNQLHPEGAVAGGQTTLLLVGMIIILGYTTFRTKFKIRSILIDTFIGGICLIVIFSIFQMEKDLEAALNGGAYTLTESGSNYLLKCRGNETLINKAVGDALKAREQEKSPPILTKPETTS